MKPLSPTRDELERRLHTTDHRVLITTDGEEALIAWRAERHELIIIDKSTTRLPTMALTTHLKHETPLGFIPILMMTTQPKTRTTILSTTDDTMTQPFDTNKIMARAQTLLRTRTLIDKLRTTHTKNEARTYSDVTTGLHNRTFLNKHLNKKFKHAMRYNEPLSLVLLAVDDWHKTVAKHRTNTDDRLLQTITTTTLRSLHQIDIVTRYGPAELAALLPKTHITDALIYTERIKREIAASPIDLKQPVASMDIAFYPNKDINNTTDLLRIATHALERTHEKKPKSICLFQYQNYLFQPK